MSRVIASPLQPSSVLYPPRLPLKLLQGYTTLQSWNFSSESDCCSIFGKLKFTKMGSEKPTRISLRCNCSTNPDGPSGPGENDSKIVLDAFFLGKALAESVNERIESAVGEFLSAIGRLQAEQQKQVQDFQEEVLERAKKAKEKAAREAMEAQGLIPKSSNVSPNGVASEIAPSAVNSAIPAEPRVGSNNASVQPATAQPDLTNDDPV